MSEREYLDRWGWEWLTSTPALWVLRWLMMPLCEPQTLPRMLADRAAGCVVYEMKLSTCCLCAPNIQIQVYKSHPKCSFSTFSVCATKKAHQHLYFLKRLRKFGMSSTTLTNFDRCTVESIEFGCITDGHKFLEYYTQRVVRVWNKLPRQWL